jgi:aldehyde:ferredoxin oxidoreductase
MVAAVTGLAMGEEGLLLAGERIWNLQRLFNARAGFSMKDDTLPLRLMEEPISTGSAAGRVWRREPLLSEYYQVRGWDEEGRPMQEKLAALGIP